MELGRDARREKRQAEWMAAAAQRTAEETATILKTTAG
jgi:hypothetical protein